MWMVRIGEKGNTKGILCLSVQEDIARTYPAQRERNTPSTGKAMPTWYKHCLTSCSQPGHAEHSIYIVRSRYRPCRTAGSTQPSYRTGWLLFPALWGWKLNRLWPFCSSLSTSAWYPNRYIERCFSITAVYCGSNKTCSLGYISLYSYPDSLCHYQLNTLLA